MEIRPSIYFGGKQNTAELTAHIEQTLDALAIQTDEAQRSEQFLEYLKCCSRFHAYSLGNILLILWQKPTATRVAGYRAWPKMNRHVRKGEKGIAILAPCIYSDKEDAAKTLIFFKTVFVFDISQTEGEELPDINWRTTEQNAGLQSMLIELVESNGWQVAYADDLEGAEGSCQYDTKTINLLKSTGTSTLSFKTSRVAGVTILWSSNTRYLGRRPSCTAIASAVLS